MEATIFVLRNTFLGNKPSHNWRAWQQLWAVRYFHLREMKLKNSQTSEKTRRVKRARDLAYFGVFWKMFLKITEEWRRVITKRPVIAISCDRVGSAFLKTFTRCPKWLMFRKRHKRHKLEGLVFVASFQNYSLCLRVRSVMSSGKKVYLGFLFRNAITNIWVEMPNRF